MQDRQLCFPLTFYLARQLTPLFLILESPLAVDVTL